MCVSILSGGGAVGVAIATVAADDDVVLVGHISWFPTAFSVRGIKFYNTLHDNCQNI